ncbi:MAG: hemerythrin domain-containing protein, partial [Metallosphaera sp.]
EGLIEDFVLAPDLSTFKEIKRAFISHVYWEEEFLFKYSKQLAVVNGLKIEHRSLWILLDKVEEYLIGNYTERAKEEMRKFFRVLLEHDGVEEGSVYQELEDLSEEEQAKLILEEIRLVNPPEGWRCSALA